ncbi:hypothetical protein Fmac_023291 [Flemingia macrophylla]|uniref:Na+/H+ antiporter n=1 Tax=Flemingia macrophylla TaxID=520843 RepID=A0ABD1LL93_9FABA
MKRLLMLASRVGVGMGIISFSILLVESFQQHTCLGYLCSLHTIETKDGFLLGLERVSSSSCSLRLGEPGPPVLLLHGLFMAGDACSPDQSLGFILADYGFDVWHLAMYDLAEMINYINSVTNSKLFLLGHSQGKIFAATHVLATSVQQLNHKRARFRSTSPTLLHYNVLVQAEDKVTNPTFSSFQPQQSSRKQFQNLFLYANNAYTEPHFESGNLTPESGTCDPYIDVTNSQDFEGSYLPKTDLLKVVAIFVAAAMGYAGIILEQYIAFNKSGVGLVMAVSLWVVRSTAAPSTDTVVSELIRASAEVSEIVFFLLGAMTIVEIVDAHQGFKLVTDNITTRSPCLLLWVIGLVTFFLSSILDSLASTIVMISLLRKLVPPTEYRKTLGAVVVIAANAGGAWSPIGAVTTTMLWIHGQISALQTMKGLFVPSVISLAVPLVLMSMTSGVNGKGQNSHDVFASEQIAPHGQLVSSVSIGALIFVPGFRALTGLPPYMGMLLGLGLLWIFTDAIHYGESERQKLKVPHALSRIDTQGALFFLGILLSVSSLEAAGILREIAYYFDKHVPSRELLASAIGLTSAVVDNVPLVAATMGMYDVSSFPQDSEFWHLIALCASTGGSILIIGSAAGVAFMGMEKVEFVWYLRKVSCFALAGYAAGIAAYLALHNLNISQPTPAEVSSLSGS